MGLPIFFQRYQNGELIKFKLIDIVNILGSNAVMDGQSIIAVSFSDTDGGEIYGADSDEFEQLSFGEGAGKKFFDALWRIADQTGAFMYWLGDGNCSAVTRKEILDQVAPDVLQDVGPARVVKDGKSLKKILLASEFGFE